MTDKEASEKLFDALSELNFATKKLMVKPLDIELMKQVSNALKVSDELMAVVSGELVPDKVTPPHMLYWGGKPAWKYMQMLQKEKHVTQRDS